MTAVFLICLLAVGCAVKALAPRIADFCVGVAGVMVVGYAVVLLIRALLAG